MPTKWPHKTGHVALLQLEESGTGGLYRVGFAMPCHVETRRFTWVTGQVSPQAETDRLLLQRFVLPSKLHVLGILDDLHLALATKDLGTHRTSGMVHVRMALDLGKVS